MSDLTPSQSQAVQSGAQQVEQAEELEHGYQAPHDPGAAEIAEEHGDQGHPVKTHLNELTLSLFKQGSLTRVRIGNAHNSSELYEHAFATTDEAHNALLDAGILKRSQLPKELPAHGIALQGITAEQLEEAGIKRHGSSNL